MVDLSKLFGKRVKLAKDPATHKKPGTSEDGGGSQNTSMTLTTVNAALKALNQQNAYAPLNANEQVNALMNTQTAANILSNSAAASPMPMSPGPASTGYDEYDSPKKKS